jgi:hypothetical protein
LGCYSLDERRLCSRLETIRREREREREGQEVKAIEKQSDELSERNEELYLRNELSRMMNERRAEDDRTK